MYFSCICATISLKLSFEKRGYLMVTLLAKLFIRDHENVTDPGVRQAYGILCGIVGICFNLILFTTKALAGLFSHSIAITADAC